MRNSFSSKQVLGFLGAIFFLSICALFPMMTYAQNGVALQASGDSGFFTPASNDQSIIYLGELFGSIPPVLAGTGSSLMGSLFKIFNTAVMSLGILFAGYTTFVGILNTAGEGEMLGKAWSSIWIPIRTVAGIGLLIPTASGYCVVQIFMMWLLIQGIGAADTLTNGIIDYMESGQKVYVPGNTPNNSGGTTVISTWDNSISNVYQGLSCMQGLQKNYPLVNAAYVQPPIAVDAPFSASLKISDYHAASSSSDTIYYNFIAYKYLSTTPNADGTYSASPVSCGTIKYDNTSDDQKKFNPYLTQGLDAIMPSLNAAAYYMVNDTGTDQDAVMQNTFNFVGSDFMNQVANTYNSYVIQANNAHNDGDYKNGEYLENIRSYGWISIGNLYWDMAKMAASNEVNAGGTVGTPAKLPWDSDYHNITANPTDYDKYVISPNLSVSTYGNTYGGQFIADLVESRNSDNNGGNGKFKTKPKTNYSNATNGMMAAMTIDVLNNMQDRLDKESENPMVSAQSLGHHILYDVEALMTAFVTLEIVMTAVFTAAGAALAGVPFMAPALGPLIALIGVYFIVLITMPFVFILYGVLMTLGGILAVIIPLIPALAFFLAGVAWIVATLETIVAAPIVAVGLIHPDGQHQVLGKAEPAIMLMTNMFLRPSLMVIGMAAGVLLSFISVQFVNFGFSQALISIIGDANLGSITWVEATMFLTTYVGLILACVNKSFSMIDALPDTVMRWISGGESTRFGGGQEAMQKLQGSQESAGQKASGDTISSSQESGQAANKTLDSGDKGIERGKDNTDKGKFKLGGGKK